METDDPRHSWVNQTLFVAQGRLLPGAVEYTVYQLSCPPVSLNTCESRRLVLGRHDPASLIMVVCSCP
jgi:uncharacterized protein DUF3237